MGGPSAAIVLHELAGLGVRRAIRVGTCGALHDDLGHGELIVVGDALAEDGTSRALGAGEAAESDPALTERLAGALPGGPTPVRIVTTDLFYDEGDDALPKGRADAWLSLGAVAVEMEAATIFTLGGRLGVATGCLLAVSDTFEGGERRRIDDERLADAAARMGLVAVAALEG
jgi:uridine phosphorylase